MNKSYIPSNGTEGDIFTSMFCDRCYKRNQCTILFNSLIGKQPKQWIYDENNIPVCTSCCTIKPKAKKKIKEDNNPKLF